MIGQAPSIVANIFGVATERQLGYNYVLLCTPYVSRNRSWEYHINMAYSRYQHFRPHYSRSVGGVSTSRSPPIRRALNLWDEEANHRSASSNTGVNLFHLDPLVVAMLVSRMTMS